MAGPIPLLQEDQEIGHLLICGFNGADTIIGESGAHVLSGDAGNDSVSGGAGDFVILWGFSGNDALNCDGGIGTDTCLNGETIANCEA